jgi:hypothetical protein
LAYPPPVGHDNGNTCAQRNAGPVGIVLYVESVGDARCFLAAAREVARRKLIIVFKVGRTADSARKGVPDAKGCFAWNTRTSAAPD